MAQAAVKPVATPAQKNSVTFDALKQMAADLGQQAGQGKDTQIKFHLKLVEAAFQGNIDLTENKHGDKDDATVLVEAYVKAQSGATVFDAKAPNQRKSISLARTCIKLGQWPKGGPGEPLQTVNNLMTTRNALRKKPDMAKKLDDATNSLMRYARAQLKSDTLIDTAELQSFCMKKEPATRDGEDILKSVQKVLTDLVNGKASHGTVQDNTPEVKSALAMIRQRLGDIATANSAAKNAAALTA